LEGNIKKQVGRIGCEDGGWLKLVQDRVQLQALVLALLINRVLLLQSCCETEFRSACCWWLLGCPFVVLGSAGHLLFPVHTLLFRRCKVNWNPPLYKVC